MEPCARCDGTGVTFDGGEGHIVTCARCAGKGQEAPDPGPPPAPKPRR